jgi:hypothetical protein
MIYPPELIDKHLAAHAGVSKRCRKCRTSYFVPRERLVGAFRLNVCPKCCGKKTVVMHVSRRMSKTGKEKVQGIRHPA